MPSREFSLRVQDMLAEIAVVEETVVGLSYETFSQNRQALRVVLYSLAVIGEAVASVIADLEVADPTMPWYQIRGMRNAVIHEYFQVDVEVIWETVRADLPVLKAALRRILKNLEAIGGMMAKLAVQRAEVVLGIEIKTQLAIAGFEL